MSWKEDYAKEAMQEGRHAARSGKTVNPHPLGTMEHRAWEQGRSGALDVKHARQMFDAIVGPLTKAAE